MVVDERNEVPADFTAVQRTAALRFEPVEKGLWSLVAFDHVSQGCVVFISEDAFGKAEIEDGVEAEEDRVVAVLLRRVLTDVAVVDIVGG